MHMHNKQTEANVTTDNHFNKIWDSAAKTTLYLIYQGDYVILV